MKTSVERLDETTVKLTVTVEAEQVDAALDAAARRLAQSVRIPGFRPGRVPRRVLETRLGHGALEQEAVSEALPEFYAEAAASEELDVVGPPKFDEVHFHGGEDATFSATVQVRPEFDVPDYAGLQVAHPDWEVTDEEVDGQLDALRERFAQLETVERPVQPGDFVVVTMTGVRDGEPVDEVAVEDLLYELPADAGGEDDDSELNRAILGVKAGDVVTFTDTLSDDYGLELSGAQVELTALVKEVKTKNLPDLDDEFALTASEFDTLAELREDLRSNLARQKRAYASASLRGKVVEEVTGLVDVALPSAMVDAEVNYRLNRFASQAQQHGMTLEQYLSAVGASPEELIAEMGEEARKTVKAQLVVDAVGRQAEIQIDQDDLGEEIGRQAARLGRPPQEIAEFMTHPDRLPALVSDAFRRKTIDHLLASVQVLGGPPDEPDEPDTQASAEEQDDATLAEPQP